MHTLKAIKLGSLFLFLFVITALDTTAEGRSVYAITDTHSIPERLDMNITGPLLNGLLENKIY